MLGNDISSCGRAVKASDLKSDSLWERRFESYQLRSFNFVWANDWPKLAIVMCNSVFGHRSQLFRHVF